MVPTKFPSVRRPSVRAPFGDDNSLVAVPYEKTVQAEPPISVLPSRNPRRAIRTRSSSSSSSRSQQHGHNPIVVAPPLPLVAPPAEDHPALRTTTAVPIDEWKRDSGLARSNSSATIREPDCETELVYQKVDTIAVAPVVQPISTLLTEQEDTASSYLTHAQYRGRSQTMSGQPCTTAAANQCNARRIPHSPSAPISPTSVVSDPLPATARLGSTSAPSRTPRSATKTMTAETTRRQTTPRFWLASPPSPRKLVKTFSLRSASRLRTKSLGEALTTAAPMQPLLLRGPPPPPASAKPKATTEPPVTDPQTGNCQSGDDDHEVLSSFATSPAPTDDVFSPIAIDIPTEDFFEDDFMDSVTFSNRGSIMIGGRRASARLDGLVNDQHPLDLPKPHHGPPPPAPSGDGSMRAVSMPAVATRRFVQSVVESNETPAPPATQDLPIQPTPRPRPRPRPAPEEAPRPQPEPRRRSEPELQPERQSLMPPPDIRVLAADVEKESQKVRSLYAVGEGLHWEDGARHSYCEQLEPTPEAPSEDNHYDPPVGHLTPAWGTPRSGTSFSQNRDALNKKDYELAGGLEDWEDIDGADVDRYGFINLPRPTSRIGTPTDLKSAQYSPRRRNFLQKRDASSPLAAYHSRPPSRKLSARSLNTVTSELSVTSMRSSRSVIRQASNLLPHNRDRRWMDEAGDMINASPGLQDLEDELKAERLSEALKRKEGERSEKWRKMAKVVRKGPEGQGMEFEFDVKNQKVIERTWKGIPDRWRAAAWWSFLAASAREHGDSTTDEQLMAEFHQLQMRSSPDDVQIDLDVPRTINRHIMFRRRYRGGQRLLFRVLHALSIYFPETGYVQGMASLAATLLCYFDEEKCFVMLVRMWLYRGLVRLYRPGFEDLMMALGDFNEHWLNKEVSEKLTELGIDPTAYGTRWYLTLFNLSIPFPAQLRVWDVYLLLGDGPSSTGDSLQPKKSGTRGPLTSEFDILHATGAALAQALRELILDSDFENGMKALTSWIPIKDEDLLMKVTKAEWKTHHGKKRA